MSDFLNNVWAQAVLSAVIGGIVGSVCTVILTRGQTRGVKLQLEEMRRTRRDEFRNQFGKLVDMMRSILDKRNSFDDRVGTLPKDYPLVPRIPETTFMEFFGHEATLRPATIEAHAAIYDLVWSSSLGDLDPHEGPPNMDELWESMEGLDGQERLRLIGKHYREIAEQKLDVFDKCVKEVYEML